MRLSGQNFINKVVHGIDVSPGLSCRIERSLYHVEMDAIGKEVGTPHQRDHSSCTAFCEPIGVQQPAALIGVHRAAIKIEIKVADTVPFRIPDFPKRSAMG